MKVLVLTVAVPPVSLARPPPSPAAVLAVKVAAAHRDPAEVFEAAAIDAGGVGGEGAAAHLAVRGLVEEAAAVAQQDGVAR